jgi:ribonucleoside-diphosphate reductase alpha chain
MIFERFKTEFAHDIFHSRYAQGQNDTWDALSERLVNDVCGDRSLSAKPTTSELMSKADQAQLVQYIKEMKFLPGGRYLYYGGRPVSFYNNCLGKAVIVE